MERKETGKQTSERKKRKTEVGQQERKTKGLRENREIGKEKNNLFLGKIEKKRGNYDEAQRCYEKSLNIIKKVHGDSHPKVAMYLHDLGNF